MDRREFLRSTGLAGGSVIAPVLLVGCTDGDDKSANAPAATAGNTAPRGRGVTVRPNGLDGWFTRLSTVGEAPVDVVCISDSYGVYQLFASWGRVLGAHLTNLGGGPAGGFRSVAPGELTPTPRWSATGGSVTGKLNTSVTGQQGLTMSPRQKSTLVDSCDGVTIVYSASPGSLLVRDGAGGPVLTTIDGTAVTGSGNIWTSKSLTYGPRTIEVEATGADFTVDMAYLHRGDADSGVRTWNLAKAGAVSADWNTAGRSLDFLANLDEAGTLGCVVIGMGTNDPGGTGGLAEYVKAIRSLTSAPIIVTSPFVSRIFSPSDSAARSALAESIADAMLDFHTIAPDAASAGRLISDDGVHPSVLGSAVIGQALAALLGGGRLGLLSQSQGLVDQVETRWVAPVTNTNPDLEDYAEATASGFTAKAGDNAMAIGVNGLSWAFAGGRFTVSSALNYGSAALYGAPADDYPQIGLYLAGLADTIGLPGATLTFGAGGGAITDTHLSRDAAGELSVNGGDGTVEVRKLRLADHESLPAGPNSVGELCSHAGVVKVCTVAGTPGTWVSVGSQG